MGGRLLTLSDAIAVAREYGYPLDMLDSLTARLTERETEIAKLDRELSDPSSDVHKIAAVPPLLRKRIAALRAEIEVESARSMKICAEYIVSVYAVRIEIAERAVKLLKADHHNARVWIGKRIEADSDSGRTVRVYVGGVSSWYCGIGRGGIGRSHMADVIYGVIDREVKRWLSDHGFPAYDSIHW